HNLAAYRGLKALERGAFDKAASLLNRAVAFQPDPLREAMLQNHLGIAWSRIGRYDEAFAAFETAWRLQPTLPEPAYNLGVLYVEQGRPDQAEEWFQRAANQSPQDTRALEFLSAICRQRQDWTQARGYLMEANRRQPLSISVNTARALVERQAGNLNRAAEIMQQSLDQDPLYPPAIFNLALLRRQQGNLVQARSLFHEFISLGHVDRMYMEIAQNMINELRQELAEQTTEDPAAARPTPPEEVLQPPTPQAFMSTAKKLADQGRIEAAVNNYILAARSAQRAGQDNLADSIITTATRTCEENPRAHFALGIYFQEIGRTDAALRHFKQAAALQPEWFEAHTALAQMAVEQGEFDAALVSLRTAVDLRPNEPNALWTLTQIFDRSLQLREPARRHYLLFAQRFPEDVRAGLANRRLEELAGTAFTP
ncbi:MAG: tetratricopeptide repeat protein, partial [Lentisphaerae bacterium]|nr:tetratricopeptide repeat protein [Lentisphaerota bacterium]